LKSKVQDIYKRGEIFEGARIERIDRNKITLFYGGRLEVLNLHVAREVLAPIEKDEESVITQKQDATELVNDILPYERGINKRAFTKQAPVIEVFLEKIEVAPYNINGHQEGLSITGLDDLNMTGYFGFKNGDVIQTINGQMLTNKQKAFQVLKKARSQPSLKVQLLRNQHKVDLSFEI
jgi:type II secretory pathway component PulC